MAASMRQARGDRSRSRFEPQVRGTLDSTAQAGGAALFQTVAVVVNTGTPTPIAPPATAKTALRRHMRRARRALTDARQRNAARHLGRRVSSLPWFNNARHIALYIAADGEIDPIEVARRAWARGRTCYLPVLLPGQSSAMRFAPWDSASNLRPNRYGIPEPVVAARALRPAAALDLILMPLVAFDPRGNRLGMGGGYYDRALAFLGRRTQWRKPRCLGLAHELQRVDSLTVDPWDIPLDGVVTDGAFYPVRRESP